MFDDDSERRTIAIMLKVELIKFEAQDIVTASSAECICDGVCYRDHGECPASEHTCVFEEYEPC